MRLFWAVVAACALPLSLGEAPVRAAELDRIALGGGASFVTYASQNMGFNAQNGIEVTMPRLPSSDAVRDALASGVIQVAEFSVDNALAMVDKNPDEVVILMGLENGPIQFVGAKGMTSVDQLRGKTILVDDPNTQNAVIMKRVLARQGLEAGRDYQMRKSGGQPLRLKEMKKDPSLGGTMVAWPEFFQMTADGHPAFGSSLDAIGPITVRVIFAKRDWAASHRDLLVRYLAAQLQALRWMTDPKNKDEVIALLAKSRSFPVTVATIAYEGFMGPHGWVRDGSISLPQMANVMKLRAEVEGSWGGKPPPPDRFLELSYLGDAIKKLDGR